MESLKKYLASRTTLKLMCIWRRNELIYKNDTRMRTNGTKGIHVQHSDEVDNKVKQTTLQPHTFID